MVRYQARPLRARAAAPSATPRPVIDASRSAPAVAKFKRPAKSVACAMLNCGFLPSSRIEIEPYNAKGTARSDTYVWRCRLTDRPSVSASQRGFACTC
jgi:hypothetical protein